MKPLTPASARITQQPTYWLLEFMMSDGFWVGERTYGTLNEAHLYCQQHRLRVIEIIKQRTDVPSYVPAKFRKEWLKSRKQVMAYATKTRP